MGKLRVMMRLRQGYASKVSLAINKKEFLYKYKSEAENLSLGQKTLSYVGLPIMKNLNQM